MNIIEKIKGCEGEDSPTVATFKDFVETGLQHKAYYNTMIEAVIKLDSMGAAFTMEHLRKIC